MVSPETERRENGRTERMEPSPHERKVSAGAVVGGSTAEAILGGGAAVLGILGLIGILPTWMAAIGVIAIGGALLIEGAAVAARYSIMSSELDGSRAEHADIAGGTSAELLGGAAGVTLGILAILNVLPEVLLPTAILVIGGTLLIGGAARPELNDLSMRRSPSGAAKKAVSASGGMMALVGIGAGVLGILALAEIGELYTLVLVSVLSVGGALLLGGTALVGRMARLMRA